MNNSEAFQYELNVFFLPVKEHCGAVIIGRNEGERLQQCFSSLLDHVKAIVYVDSGSTDGSIALARNLKIPVVSLDLCTPFTAARARNAGVIELLKQQPDLLYIQFVDGDCELNSDWVHQASVFLSKHQQHAVVCGRRRERFPDHSVYNTLCDIEWDTPIGDVDACGGDALVRAKAFLSVDGYRDDMIAGEEPEMCFRMRRLGWKIRRLDTEMTLHDAAITSFRQWWKRSQRAGYAYAEGFFLHGQTTERYRQRELCSILTWSIILPLLIFIISIQFPWALALLLLYPLQVCRLTLQNRANTHVLSSNFWYALFTTGGKFAQLTGIWRYWLNRMKKRKGTLIEYK